MPALPLVLTTAGRDALINAQNTGASNVVITQIGLSPNHLALTAATAAIAGEFKRLNLVGGQVVAPETFYVSGTDTSADTYTVRTVALYLSNGVLLGAYSQAAVLLEKAAPAMAVIEASIRLAEPLATVIEFTGGGWNNPPASEGVEGVIRLATQIEVNAGTNGTRAVTPLTLKTLLTALLAGFSPTGHTHDAGAVVSGVFAEARVPDLGMARITGLVGALAGKAATGHTHIMAEVTGLIDALAGKAAAAHTHAMGDITGLVAALAGKAAAAHTHIMGDITGLVAALALKADLAGAAFQGAVSAISFNVNTAPGHGRISLMPGAAGGIPGYVAFKDADGNDVGYAGWRSQGGRLILSGAWEFPTRPYFGAALPWDSLNFNPATKADATSAVVQRHSYIGVDGPVFENLVEPQHGFNWGGTAGLNGPFILFGAYGGGGPNMAIAGTYAGASTFKMRIKNIDDGSWGPWRSLWHDGNFNPADKANAVHSHDWSQVTGKPYLGTWSQGPVSVNLYFVDQGGNNRGGVHCSATGPGFINAVGDYMLRVTPDDMIHYVGGGARTVWTSGNFNPATKADAAHTHDWSQITAKEASAAEFRAAAGVKALTPTNVWAAAGFVVLGQAGTIPIDMAGGLNFQTVMTGNRILGAPANAKPGQSGVVYIQQDGTGNRTLDFDAVWKFEGGVKPVLSTGANTVDILVFTVIAPALVVASLMKAVS